MKILIIGQCTLHWGRMEFGNIGNYYIIEPFVRELHKAFPNASIRTTFQMSDRFCKEEKVEVLPMELYYGWTGEDLNTAMSELGSAEIFSKTGFMPRHTPYIDAVLESDLVVDFSGDIWGDNANFLGEDRFLIGLVKNRVAQLLGKKTVMLAGSPGPFNEQKTLEFAKEVYRNFDLVTNRESISIQLLNKAGFDTSKTRSYACPAFLFEPLSKEEGKTVGNQIGLLPKQKPVVGFVLCGWNFTTGPFDKWPRPDTDYEVFAQAVEYITEELGCKVYLMSHSNGFPIPPAEFELIHGRDYQVSKQLEKVLINRGISKDFQMIERVNNTWETKAIIGNFDMLVSGRIHGAVAGLSQLVPTVIIDYGHPPKAHKLQGFAIEAGAQEYIADPAIGGDIIEKIKHAWLNRDSYYEALNKQIPSAKNKARANFEELTRLF